MAEILTGLILLTGVLSAASMVHAGRKFKAYLRLRRMRSTKRRARQIATEFNPRTFAFREFQNTPVANGQPVVKVRTRYRVEPINGAHAGAFKHLREVQRLDS